MKTLRCPICGSLVEIKPSTDATSSGGASKNLLPFCSVRCQQVDLQRWLMEEYHVPDAPDPDDEVDEEYFPPSLN
jgi:endogenous inhibitor of DNA gyrase (YacG/DUF329 family)